MTLALRFMGWSPPCQSRSKGEKQLTQRSVPDANKRCTYFVKRVKIDSMMKSETQQPVLDLVIHRIWRMGTLGGGGPVPLN